MHPEGLAERSEASIFKNAPEGDAQLERASYCMYHTYRRRPLIRSNATFTPIETFKHDIAKITCSRDGVLLMSYN